MFKINIGVNKEEVAKVRSNIRTNNKITCNHISCKKVNCVCEDCIFDNQEARFTIEELKEAKRVSSNLENYRINIGENGETLNIYCTVEKGKDIGVMCDTTKCGSRIDCCDCVLDGRLWVLSELIKEGKAVKEGK